jgi:hypothetical protein
MLADITQDFDLEDRLTDIHKGIVVDNHDPLRIGRVKAYVPGVLEGQASRLPWCSPVAPSNGGGSPSNYSFDVPAIGSEIQVQFLGKSAYLPVYTGIWISQSLNAKEVYGKNYPASYGSMHGDGSFSRGDRKAKSVEYFHPNGYLFQHLPRSTNLSIPGDLNIKVDGRFNVSEDFWSSGGGGLGSVLDEIMYAVLDGPYVRGILDLIALLPIDPLSPDSRKVSLETFAEDMGTLRSLGNALNATGAQLVGLEEVLAGVLGKDRIRAIMVSLGGVNGLTSILSRFFGFFGKFSSGWLEGSESLIDAVIFNMTSPFMIRNILTENNSLPIEDVEDRLVKIRKGFSSLYIVGSLVKDLQELADYVDSWPDQWEAGRIISAMPDNLEEFVHQQIMSIFERLWGASQGIDVRSRTIYLNRLHLSKYFLEEGSSVGRIEEITLNLLGLVAPYHLGMHGHIVLESLLHKYDLARIASLAISRGVSQDHVLKFVEDAKIAGADLESSYGSLIWVLEQYNFIDPGIMNWVGGTLGSVARANQTQGDVFGLKIFVEKVYRWFLDTSNYDSSGASGSLGNAFGLPEKTASKYTGEAFNTFLEALDLPALFADGILLTDIEKFFEECLLPFPALRAAPYGGNIHQIIDTGMGLSVAPHIKDSLNTIEMKFMGVPESLTFFPISYVYSSVFGSPHLLGSSGQNNMYHASHRNRAVSSRLVRLQEAFSANNLRLSGIS